MISMVSSVSFQDSYHYVIIIQIIRGKCRVGQNFCLVDTSTSSCRPPSPLHSLLLFLVSFQDLVHVLILFFTPQLPAQLVNVFNYYLSHFFYPIHVVFTYLLSNIFYFISFTPYLALFSLCFNSLFFHWPIPFLNFILV